MNRDDITILYRYNQWAWERLLAKVALLSAEQYAAPASAPHGGVRGTLVHAMSAETIWRSRWKGASPDAMLREEDFPTFAALAERWARDRAKLREFVASLTDEMLTSTIQYKTTKGAPMEDLLWHLMVHVVNHAIQHRAETAMIVSAYEYSPGDLDLLTFLRLGR